MVRGLIGLLLVAVVLVAAAVVVIRVPGLAKAVLPAPALDSLRDWGLVAEAGADDPKPSLGTRVEDHLSDTAAGLVATPMIAATAGNKPVFIYEVMTGYSGHDGLAVPAEITTIRPILGCRLTRPMPGTLVGHGTAGDSQMPLGITTYSDLHLAGAVQAFADASRKVGPDGVITLDGPRYQAYDVAVTATGAPIYLVLENRSGNRIWNIHVAEGVRIERVVLLGGNQAGVANLDPLVPVEVILGTGLADCGIVPAYAPTPGKLADGDPGEGDQPMSKAELDKALGLAEAYDIWFRDSFEVRASESRVGFDTGMMSVIGPVPTGEAPRPVWASVSGARLRTTHDRFLDIEGQVAAGQDFDGRVRAIAKSLAFGDLGFLTLGGTF